MENEYPKIRNVEPIPIQFEGQRYIGLRDPHNLNDKGEMVVMTPQAFSLVTLFNGRNSITEIQATLTRMSGGAIFPREVLTQMVQTLKDNLMLEDSHFREAIQKYRALGVRNSILEGKSYPEDRESLEKMIDEILADSPIVPANKVKAYIAPHIDIHRAKSCYARVYNAVKSAPFPKIYVVFGTAHHADPGMRFIGTEKSYQTPYGILPTHSGFIERLKAKCPSSFFENDYIHKGEHSIEFQVLFLQHLFQKDPEISVVPILIGSFQDFIESGKSPSEESEIEETWAALRETAKEIGNERICWAAGVDLCHVGLRFGDQTPPDPSYLEQVREHDMKCLDQISRCDAEGFFSTISSTQNRYSVCGVSPIYALLKVIQGTPYTGQLLDYDQSFEQETGSAVTFAGMIFY